MSVQMANQKTPVAYSNSTQIWVIIRTLTNNCQDSTEVSTLRRFGRTCCLNFQDIQEHTEEGEAGSSENPVTTNPHGVISQKNLISVKATGIKLSLHSTMVQVMHTCWMVKTDLYSSLNTVLGGESQQLASRFGRLAPAACEQIYD